MEFPAPAMSRRQVVRTLAGGSLALAASGLIAVRPQAASAGIGWCRVDPVVSLYTPDGRRGNTASIYMAAAAEDFELNNSSADIVVEHPKDAKTKLIWVDPNGYFGQGSSTNFAIGQGLAFGDGYMDVRVRCFVPASRQDMKIRLEFAPGPIAFAGGNPLPAPVVAAETGHANRWITLEARLPYA